MGRYQICIFSPGNLPNLRFCGSENPPAYVSTSNQLHITFHSDYSISRSGFR